MDKFEELDKLIRLMSRLSCMKNSTRYILHMYVDKFDKLISSTGWLTELNDTLAQLGTLISSMS